MPVEYKCDICNKKVTVRQHYQIDRFDTNASGLWVREIVCKATICSDCNERIEFFVKQLKRNAQEEK